MLEDYEIVCPLNYNTNQQINSYKARHKLTEESVILHSFDLTKYQNNDKNQLIKAANERKNNNDHPNLLKFLTIFEDKPFKILYIITEYCYNGNINTIINNCVKDKRFLSEELICRIIYQLLCAIKTIPIKLVEKLCNEEIFIDDDFNIKLLNFQINPDKNQKLNCIKTYKLARIMFNLCTSKKYEKSIQNNEIKKVQYYYSNEFINLLITLLKDHCLLYKNIDKVLCNSTILLKSSQWRKERSFFIITDNCDDDYLRKSKTLKQKELELYQKEEQLKEKEHNLDLREKRLDLIEKQINDKLQLLKNQQKTNRKTIWHDLDTSLSADCGESVIITAKKLDHEIIKPIGFVRSKSERRIKFKGHSPLKKLNYSRKTTRKTAKLDNSRSPKRSDDGDCRPISWNEENKRHAFDLLRIMNTANDADIKHTYL